MTILEQLAEYAKERTGQAKKEQSLHEIRQRAMSLPKGGFLLKTR